jgi:hypothetical protein
MGNLLSTTAVSAPSINIAPLTACFAAITSAKGQGFQRVGTEGETPCQRCQNQIASKKPTETSIKGYKDIGPDFVVDSEDNTHKNEDALIFLIDLAISQIDHTLLMIQKTSQDTTSKLSKRLLASSGRTPSMTAKTGEVFPGTPIARPSSFGLSDDDPDNISANHTLYQKKTLGIISNEIDPSTTNMAHNTKLIAGLTTTMTDLAKLKNEIQLAKLEKSLDSVLPLSIFKEQIVKITQNVPRTMLSSPNYITALTEQLNGVVVVLSKIVPPGLY